MYNILITGYKGFIGRHFWDHYSQDRNVQIYGIDIKDGIDVRKTFREDHFPNMDLVIHCAAVVGGRQKIENEPLEVAVDLEIDAAMFRWALRTHAKRIIYFSSSAAYPIRYQGSNTQFSLKESDINFKDVEVPLGLPDLTYGWVKLTGEYLASFVEKQGIPVHIFRPFSGYGVDQDLDYPFPSFMKRAREKVDSFPIWGNGSQVRDWVHVNDVIGCVLEAIKQDFRGPVNICTGRATSFNELAKLACKAAGYTPSSLDHDLSAPTGVRYRVGNPTLMNKLYQPKISLEEGIAESVNGRI